MEAVRKPAGTILKAGAGGVELRVAWGTTNESEHNP